MKTLAIIAVAISGFLMAYDVVKPIVAGVSKVETALKVKKS